MAYEDELINGDKDLLALLKGADPADLGVLVDFLTDSGKGRLAMASDVRKALEHAKRQNKYSHDELLLLIRELQHFGGNSVANLVRRTGVPYAEIVRDVLKYVGGKIDNESVEMLELKILEKLVAKAWEKMSERERAEFARNFHAAHGPLDLGLAAVLAAVRAGGLNAAKAALMAVGSVATLLAEGAFSVGASAVAGRAAGLALGPIGALVAGAAGVQMLAKEAYRVTVPCVAQIAYIRQKQAANAAAP
ncbi:MULTISPECIES: ubiquinol-cytochrome C chaperone family protein [Azotobacter]|nr:ubiquinol-cytochrome C chaperone family protein [Azotobacter chroococcum]